MPERTGDTAASVLASAGAFGYRWNGLRRGVRARCREPDPRDRPELRQTEPVAAVVPRLALAVQSELAPRAPTPWTCRYARRPADTAAASSPSAPRVIAATPTARRAAGRPVVAGRCGLPEPAISRVPRAVSTIATSNAPTATGNA